MKAHNRTLEEWFSEIRNGYLALPRFQRHEAWSHKQVNTLLNTVLSQLPVGAVLTLDVGDKKPFIARAVVGAPNLNGKETAHLLDGQQRLTSLWRSLHHDYENKMFFVCVHDDETFTSEVVSRWKHKSGSLYPMWTDNPAEQWKRKYIPLELLCPSSEKSKKATEWAKSIGLDADSTLDLVGLIGDLKKLIAGFNIPYLSLPKTTETDVALDVFIKMNTSSTPLSNYDIVVAQVEASTGQSLHDLVDDIKSEAPNAEKYFKPADWVLAVGALLQDKSPNRSVYLEPSFGSGLIEQWELIKLGIKRTTEFLHNQKIFDNQRLATEVVLYPLAALWSKVSIGGDSEGEARVLLKKYLWRALFTERYEKTSATRAQVDFKELSEVLEGKSAQTPKILNNDEFPLPPVEEIMTAGWPKRRDRLPRAILALSLNSGAYDFADGSEVTDANIKNREYHHLFPDAWLKNKNIETDKIYLALNCALVTWTTNRTMAAKAPSVYMNERMNVGEDEVIRRLNSHKIDLEKLTSDDYEEFLQDRASLIHEAMLEICS